jgi:hypothetical protein
MKRNSEFGTQILNRVGWAKYLSQATKRKRLYKQSRSAGSTKASGKTSGMKWPLDGI